MCGLTIIAGCRGDPSRASSNIKAGSVATQGVADDAIRPLSQSERRTTAGAIVLRNLNGEIDALEARLRITPSDVGAAAALVEALNMRALCLGRLSDHARAAAVAEQVAQAAPEQAKSYLLRARGRTAFHRFAAALADLREAESRGAPADDVALLRANILSEIGEPDEAMRTLGARAAGGGNILSLGVAASLQADAGEFEQAQQMFRRAVEEYRDVSPLPIAWIYIRQAMTLEKRGRVDQAREFYEAALERFPSFVPALSKLADLETAAGRTGRAEVLLRAVRAVSDDPDHLSRLAALLRQRGEEAEASRLRDEAQGRFDALVAEFPEAFAAHAAEFWLGVGGDTQKGLELARVNWKVRHRPEDQALLARAEEAARNEF